MVRFVLTSYGPFPGVPENPSQRLLERFAVEKEQLMAAHGSRVANDLIEKGGDVEVVCVPGMEVSCAAVDAWFADSE